MTAKIVNLTRHSIDCKIEEFLEHNSERPYCPAFANPAFRHKLIAYVLCRVKNYYVTVEAEQEAALDGRSLNFSVQRHQLDELIHKGIDLLLQTPADWMQRHLPASNYTLHTETEPSHWFG